MHQIFAKMSNMFDKENIADLLVPIHANCLMMFLEYEDFIIKKKIHYIFKINLLLQLSHCLLTLESFIRPFNDDDGFCLLLKKIKNIFQIHMGDFFFLLITY